MEVKISERMNSYCKDILDTDGSIIVTFSSGIKNMWFNSMCVMKQDVFDANVDAIRNEFNTFISEAKQRAIANGLTVF